MITLGILMKTVSAGGVDQENAPPPWKKRRHKRGFRLKLAEGQGHRESSDPQSKNVLSARMENESK